MWALWNEFLFPFIRPKLPYLRHWRELTAKLFWKQGYFVFILCRSRVLEYFCTLPQARYITECFFCICLEKGTFWKFMRSKNVTFFSNNVARIIVYNIYIRPTADTGVPVLNHFWEHELSCNWKYTETIIPICIQILHDNYLFCYFLILVTRIVNESKLINSFFFFFFIYYLHAGIIWVIVPISVPTYIESLISFNNKSEQYPVNYSMPHEIKSRDRSIRQYVLTILLLLYSYRRAV